MTTSDVADAGAGKARTRRGRAAVAHANGGDLRLRLHAPGMTALHRVGLAGLALTLRTLDEGSVGADLREHGEWAVEPQEVTLRWQGDGVAFFGRLLAASYRLTPDGVIWPLALGDPRDHPETSLVLHNAMLGTFLQHGPTTREGAKQTVSRNVGSEEEPAVVRYLPLTAYKHQGRGWGKRQPFRFDGLSAVDLAGWLYPGGVVRHNQSASETALKEPPERALALLFAPVGAVYFQVQRRTPGTRPEYATVLPEVRDLITYGENRQLLSGERADWFQVAGTADAALRVLTEMRGVEALESLEATRCSVVGFGTTPWSAQQKTRLRVFEVRDVVRADLDAYRLVRHVLTAKRKETRNANGNTHTWWQTPQTPDLVAENAIAGRPWWRGFAALWQRLRQDVEGDQRKWVLRDEQEGLARMVSDERVIGQGAEATLVRAFHAAWRRRAGELGQRARESGTPFASLYEREYERVRISVARCKNAAMLRQTLTDFWARAGQQPTLQEGWEQLLPLLGTRWQEARDLALLALASYRKPRNEQEATEDADIQEDEA
jgi:CRISPR-associated protein Cas8a1/Csx13